MSFPGERSKPTSGVKGSKGGAGSQPRIRLPKQAAPRESSELQKQSTIYLKERNRTQRVKRLREEMLLAEARGELISKDLATKQAAYLLIELRQKALALPEKMRVKFGPERFNHEMVQAAKVLVAEALTSVSQLPEAANPNWLERLKDEDEV
jgi:hypothetical protein